MKLKLTAVLLLHTLFCHAQKADTTIWQVAPPTSYKFIRIPENTIHNSEKLNLAFEKLQRIKATKKGVFRIVHIGDSHIQADQITTVLRNGFQAYFGNAGRGLVFPYQLAKSNAPSDITASSNAKWEYNRIAHPEIDIPCGISGFGIHAASTRANVSLGLKDVDSMSQYFNRLIFFLGKDSSCYTLSAPRLRKTVLKHTRPNVDTPSLIINTDSLLSEFTLAKCDDPDEPSKGTYSFYGVSLERKDTCGVIYHTIGCNGTQYEQYDNNELFCGQLHAIKGDLYIISMGTNEAQNVNISEEQFTRQCDSLVSLIRSISPKAPVIITTPPGSYFKGKKPNAILEKVTHALTSYCAYNDIPYWDLYHLSGGYRGALYWKKSGLMAKDLVHYTKDGYQLQGSLLLNALSHNYNTYNKAHPYKPKTMVIINKVKTANK